jgi:hypothetical protein
MADFSRLASCGSQGDVKLTTAIISSFLKPPIDWELTRWFSKRFIGGFQGKQKKNTHFRCGTDHRQIQGAN